MVKNSPILEIQGLKASVNDTAVIKDLNLTVNPGEIHAIMGKNGSGKSTFSKIVAGHSAYRVTAGNILFNGESILEVEPEELRNYFANSILLQQHELEQVSSLLQV